MAISRKKALERLQSLAPRVEEHLNKIDADRDNDSVGHWKTEVKAWLDQMEAVLGSVGKRTGEMWSRKIEEWRTRLEE